METLDENDVKNIAGKIGKFLIIRFFVYIFFAIFINHSLVNLFHSHELFTKRDPIEIDIIVRSILSTLNSIIIASLIFKVKFKEMFSNEKQVCKLSLTTKTKLTFLFIGISMISVTVSRFIMDLCPSAFDMPMPETTLYFSIFAMFVAPIIEEILFRGIILNQLKFMGYLPSIIISSIIFGLGHGTGFFHTFIIGLILGSVFILTGNIKWSIIMHFIVNSISFLYGETISRFLPNISIQTAEFIIGIVLLAIFLIVSIKDKELKELYNKVSIKDIINKFKRDKEKYVVFINEPNIVIVILILFVNITMGLIFIFIS